MTANHIKGRVESKHLLLNVIQWEIFSKKGVFDIDLRFCLFNTTHKVMILWRPNLLFALETKWYSNQLSFQQIYDGE